MPVRLPVSPRRHSLHIRGPEAFGLAAAIVGVIAFAVAAWLLPAPLVLPVLSTVSIAVAAGLALFAHRQPRSPYSDTVTYWDVAGAITLVGIVAALLSEPDQIFPLLEARRNH